MTLEVVTKATELAGKVAKHAKLIGIISLAPVPEIQQPAQQLLTTIPAVPTNIMGVIQDALSKAESLIQELISTIMGAATTNAFNEDFPSRIQGICSFISTVTSGEWFLSCLYQANDAWDSLVQDPYADQYMPRGIKCSTPEELSHLLAQSIDGDTLHCLHDYLSGANAAITTTTSCCSSAGDRISKGFDSLNLAAKLDALLGGALTNVIKVLTSGIEDIEAYLNALEPCLTVAEPLCPNIKTVSGFNTLKALSGQGSDIMSKCGSAKGMLKESLDYDNKMGGYMESWL